MLSMVEGKKKLDLAKKNLSRLKSIKQHSTELLNVTKIAAKFQDGKNLSHSKLHTTY